MPDGLSFLDSRCSLPSKVLVGGGNDAGVSLDSSFGECVAIHFRVIPNEQNVIPNEQNVIPNEQNVIPNEQNVIPNECEESLGFLAALEMTTKENNDQKEHDDTASSRR